MLSSSRMTDRDIAADARALLLGNSSGVLGTISEDVPGYPFGSVVPYCLDRAGVPLIVISRLAQHTKNIQANSHVSLTVVESGPEDVQQAGRISWLGDARPVPASDADSLDRFCRFFPQSGAYVTELDFDLYRISPVKIRYIGGFGKIHWVGDEAMLLPSPFDPEQEAGIIEHMNEDHVDAMVGYCAQAGIDCGTQQPVMCNVDAEGFHLRLGARIVRFAFPGRAENPGAVRKFLVDMVRGS